MNIFKKISKYLDRRKSIRLIDEIVEIIDKKLNPLITENLKLRLENDKLKKKNTQLSLEILSSTPPNIRKIEK